MHRSQLSVSVASELGVEASLVITCRLSYPYLRFLIVFIRLQDAEMTMGIVLQLCLNLSDASDGPLTAGQRHLIVLKYLPQSLSAQFWKANR